MWPEVVARSRGSVGGVPAGGRHTARSRAGRHDVGLREDCCGVKAHTTEVKQLGSTGWFGLTELILSNENKSTFE